MKENHVVRFNAENPDDDAFLVGGFLARLTGWRFFWSTVPVEGIDKATVFNDPWQVEVVAHRTGGRTVYLGESLVLQVA